MKNALKWVGIILCSMIGLIVLSAAGLFIYGQISFKTTNTDRPLYPIEADTSQDGIERGKYLMETATGCTDGCHTSAGNDTPLSGNSVEISEGSISFTFAVPNLTPDAETGLGNWKDAEIARAIREGVDKDGVSLVVMPFNNLWCQFYKLNGARLKCTQPSSSTWMPSHWTSRLNIANVYARRLRK